MKKPVLIGGAIVVVLLVALLVFAMTNGSQATADREIPGMGIPRYVYAGADDTLYGFTDSVICAIGSDGYLKYRYAVPEGWSIGSQWHIDSSYNYVANAYYCQAGGSDTPVFSLDNGTLYVYLVRNITGDSYPPGRDTSGGFYGDGQLVSISPGGKAQWSLPLKSFMVWPSFYPYNAAYSDASLYSSGGRVYAYHGYNETIIGSDGTVLFNIENVADPAAVDEAGNLYLTEATETYGTAVPMVNSYGMDYVPMSDYREPSVILDSFYPNGTIRWRTYNIDVPGHQRPNTLPLYDRGMLYMLSDESVRAYDAGGSLIWIKRLSLDDYPFEPADAGIPSYVRNETFYPIGGPLRAYPQMPFDSAGNLYVQLPLENTMVPGVMSYLIVIDRNGSEVSSRKMTSTMYCAVDDDLAYGTEASMNLSGVWYPEAAAAGDLDTLQTATLVASDLRSGQRLWSYTFPTDMRTVSLVNASNLYSLFPASLAGLIARYDGMGVLQFTDYNAGMPVSPAGGVSEFSVHPGADVVYVDFQTYRCESPIVFDRSKFVYSGGLYALGRNGTLLWRIPLAPNDQLIAVGNSTILYGSGDGKVYVKYLGAAAGIALLSALAIFGKLFLAGTISRARSRLDKNANRTAVLRYIVDHPGSTMYEIARDTGINTGTVRYHLLILDINHKIAEYRTDGKYVRFFTNSNSYSLEERMIISLMRREAMGNVLKLLASKPGASNAEISGELNIPESVTSRCTKELAEKGLVVRTPAGNGFLIREKSRDSVVRMMGRI